MVVLIIEIHSQSDLSAPWYVALLLLLGLMGVSPFVDPNIQFSSSS